MYIRPYLQPTTSFCSHPLCPTFVKNVKSYSSWSSRLFPASLGGRTSSVQIVPRHFFSSSPAAFFRYQTPAPRPSRRPLLNFLNKIPHNVVFYGIIGLNSSVFMMWFMALERYVSYSTWSKTIALTSCIHQKQEKDPSALVWMEQNFTNSWKNLSMGRMCVKQQIRYLLINVCYSWTPLAACFSHKDFFHIFLNSFTFFFMAKPVLHLLGSRQFIFLYIGGLWINCLSIALTFAYIPHIGGLFASFSSLLYSQWAQRDNYCSHGASGKSII